MSYLKLSEKKITNTNLLVYFVFFNNLKTNKRCILELLIISFSLIKFINH